MSPFEAFYLREPTNGEPLFEIPPDTTMSPADQIRNELDTDYMSMWHDACKTKRKKVKRLERRARKTYLAKHNRVNLISLYELGEIVRISNPNYTRTSKSKKPRVSRTFPAEIIETFASNVKYRVRFQEDDSVKNIHVRDITSGTRSNENDRPKVKPNTTK